MIKFRAWYIPFGKYGAMQEMIYSRASHVLALAETEPEKYITEQFIGLKDVNGKDIYEGDIIKSIPNDPLFELYKFGVVMRSRIDLKWCYESGNIEHTIWASGRYRAYEVIGNVHENPELLEEDK